MALLDIPVWTIPPDWSDPVNETLGWLTTIYKSATGVEQRQSLRLSPRRALEFSVAPIGRWRTYFDALLSTQYQDKIYAPFWHDRAVLNADHSNGTTTITVIGERSEMATAGVLFIPGSMPWIYDILEVASVEMADGRTEFTVEGGTSLAWAKGSPVYAIGVAAVRTQPGYSRLSDEIYRATVRFDYLQTNDWPYSLSPDTYRSYPVVRLDVNDGADQSGSYFREMSQLDNQVGIPTRQDYGTVGFPIVATSGFVVGRTLADDLRSLLYSLKGRAKHAWFVSETTDFFLHSAMASGSTSMVVERGGFAELTGPLSGRQDIRILLRDGQSLYRRIASASLNGDHVTETLTLDTAPGIDLTPDNVVRIGFLLPGRLDQDEVQLSHVTDTDGVCSTNLSFKVVPDLRVAADWDVQTYPLVLPGGCGPSTSGRFWVRRNNGPWNGDSSIRPWFGEGGIDCSSLGTTLYPVVGLNTGLFAGQHAAINFGGGAFISGLPRRALTFGSAVLLNESDMSAGLGLETDKLRVYALSERTRVFVRADSTTAAHPGFRYFELNIPGTVTDTSIPWLDTPPAAPQNIYVGYATGAFNLTTGDLSGSVLLSNSGTVNSPGGNSVDVGFWTRGDTIGVLIYVEP